jgi:hypothetical protein
MGKKIGFVYFDELQHIHHFLSPAVELSKDDNIQVDILTYEAKHEYLKMLIELMGGKHVNIIVLSTYFYRQIIEKITGREQPSALYIYKKHIKKFLEYDALVFTDHTAGEISVARSEASYPHLILLGHGAGDSAYGYKETHNLFDLALVAGEKKRKRLEKLFPKRSFEIQVGGYGKFDVVEAEFSKIELFDNSNPVILYSPHFKSEISSWHKQGLGILNYFLEHTEYNLIFAPHFNLFNKKATKESVTVIKKYADAPNIFIDLGSIKSINMSYTLASDIYLGDVSSQVYEYMYKIRPMIFYNAHNIIWEDDVNYTMWKAGKVVSSIEELDKALLIVDEWSVSLEKKQIELFGQTFDRTNDAAGERISNIIKDAI